MEEFTDVVNRSFDGPDPPKGVYRVYIHGFRLQELLFPRIQWGPWELGPSGLLVVRARIGFWGLGHGDGIGPIAKFGGWGRGGAPGFETWVPAQLLALCVGMAPVAPRPTPCSWHQLSLRCRVAEAHQVSG
jgi:hypothetical protein